jgi:hypothetical protein
VVNSREDEIRTARAELDQRGVPFSEENFLRCVRVGNIDVVNLYLRAGISPDATPDGESALAASANQGHKEIAQALINAGAKPLGFFDGLKTGVPKKDLWEKLVSLSGVFTLSSSLVIAGVGWFFTSSYNNRQLQLAAAQATRDQESKAYQNRLVELQAVENMIPLLTKDESSKQGALIAISVLASPEIATRMAKLYGGQGSINALTTLATSGTATSGAVSALTSLAANENVGKSGPAHVALGEVLAGKKSAIVTLEAKALESPHEGFCNGFIVDSNRGWIVTAGYCVGNTRPEDFSIRLNDGTAASVSRIVLSHDKLLAFLKIEGARTEFKLRSSPLLQGDTLSQVQYDFHVGSLVVNIGPILQSGLMMFVEKGNAIQAVGLIVSLHGEPNAQLGAAGSPLLDSEGNAACMTYQSASTNRSDEQCVASSVIAEAMKTL